MIGKKSALRLALVVIAGSVLVSLPVTSALADTGQMDNVFGSGEDGDPGGIHADPDQWDIDSWKRGTVEETQPEAKLPESSGFQVVSRVLGWLQVLLQELQEQQRVMSQNR